MGRNGIEDKRKWGKEEVRTKEREQKNMGIDEKERNRN